MYDPSDKTKLYGLTHDPVNRRPMVRQVRMLKVGIGYPKGPNIHVYIARSGEWVIEEGVANSKQPKRTSFKTMAEAKAYYTERRRSVPERSYPAKFPYFTFLRIGMDGGFVHDFEAIERHGSMPTEIEVVFLNDAPLEQSMQWWTAAELKCEGNGIDARRRLDLAVTEEEKKLAETARKAGEKFFSIIDGCHMRGCPYSRGKDNKAPLCKPHSRLMFQLAYNPTLGGTAVFDTTGWGSGANLFSCLHQVRSITGRGDADIGRVAGIPLQMVLRPYRTSHNGQPTTQYGVSLQLRAADAQSLVRNVIEKADEFLRITGTPLLLEAPDELGEVIPESAEARTMEAEFYPETTEEAEWEEYPEGSTTQDGASDDDGRSGQPAGRPDSEAPRRKSEQAETPPQSDPLALIEALGKFKMKDKQGKVDWFEELKSDLFELTGAHDIWASIREKHPGNGAAAAAECFREAWLTIASLKGAA